MICLESGLLLMQNTVAGLSEKVALRFIFRCMYGKPYDSAILSIFVVVGKQKCKKVVEVG